MHGAFMASGRPSVSGDAARRQVDRLTERLSPEQRQEEERRFNDRLAELIANGRLRG